MANIQSIINGKIQSLYVQGVMRRKGWSVDYTRTLIVEFLTCGCDVSLYDFLEAEL